MITFESITKDFGKLRAVNNLNLNVTQGELFAFLGPNAAGKTTTIKMIAGLLRPSSGRIMVCGVDVVAEPLAAKRLVSYIPDFPFLYEKLTPEEFVRFVADIHGIHPEVAARSQETLFQQFHLVQFAKKPIDSLSHGTRQRLAVCAALLRQPRVLIVDEPMVGLDPAHVKIFKDELRARARGGTTIFLSTHQLSIAAELADRIGIISKGCLTAVGSVTEILNLTATRNLESAFLALTETPHESQEENCFEQEKS